LVARDWSGEEQQDAQIYRANSQLSDATDNGGGADDDEGGNGCCYGGVLTGSDKVRA